MELNNLYPNFDIAGSLNETGVSLMSEAGGQLTQRSGQSLNAVRNFGNKTLQSLSVTQHSLSSMTEQSHTRQFTDRNLLFD